VFVYLCVRVRVRALVPACVRACACVCLARRMSLKLAPTPGHLAQGPATTASPRTLRPNSCLPLPPLPPRQSGRQTLENAIRLVEAHAGWRACLVYGDTGGPRGAAHHAGPRCMQSPLPALLAAASSAPIRDVDTSAPALCARAPSAQTACLCRCPAARARRRSGSGARPCAPSVPRAGRRPAPACPPRCSPARERIAPLDGPCLVPRHPAATRSRRPSPQQTPGP
jgi:hypothetical protein